MLIHSHTLRITDGKNHLRRRQFMPPGGKQAATGLKICLPANQDILFLLVPFEKNIQGIVYPIPFHDIIQFVIVPYLIRFIFLQQGDRHPEYIEAGSRIDPGQCKCSLQFRFQQRTG